MTRDLTGGFEASAERKCHWVQTSLRNPGECITPRFSKMLGTVLGTCPGFRSAPWKRDIPAESLFRRQKRSSNVRIRLRNKKKEINKMVKQMAAHLLNVNHKITPVRV